MPSKLIFILLFVLNSNCFAVFDFDPFNFKGETNYTKSSKETLNTSLIIEYKINLYEADNKAWAYTLNGKVHNDYDHFNNEIHTNVFTTLGVDF
jgi:hypothetical protein